MTDIVLREDSNQSVELAPSRGVAQIVEWAESARAAYSVAESLVKTSFVPEAFRGKAHEATAAILAGSEVGLSPMAALRSFDVIQGTAAPRALTLRAIVQSQGHLIWSEESTPGKAVVCGRRRGEDMVHRSVWTIERARQLKLTGKPNWQNQPQAMLLARATSECARLVAADAILGLPYSAEELEDQQATPTTTVQREPAKRTVQHKSAEPPPMVEPDLTPEPAPEPAPQNVAGITKPQSAKLHAAFGNLGYGADDRDRRLHVASRLIGRNLESSSDLTKDEASTVIDLLEQALASDDPTEHLSALIGEDDGQAVMS